MEEINPTIRQKFEALGAKFYCTDKLFIEKLEGIKAFIFDWDGVFNNGIKANNFNDIGIYYYRLNKIDSSIHYYNKSIELNPASAIDYANLGVNYRKLEKKDEAIKYFELALSLDPTIEFAKDNLAQLTDAA